MRAILFAVLLLPLVSLADASGKSDCVWREAAKKERGAVEQFEISCPVIEKDAVERRVDRIGCRVSVIREGNDEKVELSVYEFIADKNKKNDFMNAYKVSFYPPDEILLFYGYQSSGKTSVALSSDIVEEGLFDFRTINYCVEFAKGSPFARVNESIKTILSVWSRE